MYTGISFTMENSKTVRTININRIQMADFIPENPEKGVKRSSLWIHFNEDEMVQLQGQNAERVHHAIQQATRFLDIEDTP